MTLPSGARFGVTICYENVFPWVGREVTARGARMIVMKLPRSSVGTKVCGNFA